MLAMALSLVGFIAVTSMNCEGKVTPPAARQMWMQPSSNGWRSFTMITGVDLAYKDL